MTAAPPLETLPVRRIETSGTTIALRTMGAGPPLLLLHGYPETHLMWRHVAPRLMADFTLVMPDLRGYGASGKPAGGKDHGAYAKRAMGADMAEVMSALGHERFHLAGHDRGGRVAHRLAKDHASRILSLALLDIVPTRHIYSAVTREIASLYFHWFLLIRPAPFPESLIEGAPQAWLDWILGGMKGGALEPAVRRAYEEAFIRKETIHATCEDYRAGATIDLVHDEADFESKLVMPTLVLYGKNGALPYLWDVKRAWADYAPEAEYRSIPGGHFFAEEHPAETAEALNTFFLKGY